MSDGPYVSRKYAQRSYRPKGYGMSPGLLRARRPYRVRNAITGVIIGAFTVGVWWYSMRAVSQDVFDDVDDQAKALAEERARNARESQAAAPSPAPTPVVPPALSAVSTRPRGVLAKLVDSRYPGVLDPRSKTLIWGAPPVDKVGRIGERP